MLSEGGVEADQRGRRVEAEQRGGEWRQNEGGKILGNNIDIIWNILMSLIKVLF
jgi:hypothetical protein